MSHDEELADRIVQAQKLSDAERQSYLSQVNETGSEFGTLDPDFDSFEKVAELDSPSRQRKKLFRTVPKSIGPYKILAPIGRGGMGQVYSADQQEPVRRRVALKVISVEAPSDAILARFDAERQALAMMDHQNIAKVLDAGITDDGKPYFAMELVRGIPITDYCNQNRLAVSDRLSLFVQTCRAIQHAHQKGIIHRDLKPSNVLVTSYDGNPVAKVIDFGLAKAIHDQIHLAHQTLFTQQGQILGTLEYMSPEQAELSSLDIDTRTDVYSLGVILYELLTGTTPIGRERLRSEAFDKILALIREEDAVRPSSKLSLSGDHSASMSDSCKTEPRRLRKLVSGDLDCITVKALEKDRTRRYDGAASLADDIERYLRKDPVNARPPEVAYLIRKSFAKHRARYVWAVALLASLLFGLASTVVMWHRALDAEAAAVTRADSESSLRKLAEQETKKAQLAFERARVSQNKAERAYARSQFHAATAQFNAHRFSKSIESLNQIPLENRKIEWYLSRQQFLGSDYAEQVFEGNPLERTLSERLIGATPDVRGQLEIGYSESGEQIVMRKGNRFAICDARNGQRLQSTEGQDGPVSEFIASTSRDLHKLVTDQLVERPHAHIVNYLSEFSTDFQPIASAFSKDYAYSAVLGIQSGNSLQKFLPGELSSRLRLFGVEAHREVVRPSFDTWHFKLTDLKSQKVILEKEIHASRPGALVNSMSFDPSGSFIVITESTGEVQVLDLNAQGRVQYLLGHEGACVACFSPDASHVALLGADGVLRGWNLRATEESMRIRGQGISSVAFSPDSQSIVVGCLDGGVRRWNVKTREFYQYENRHDAQVTSVAWSSHGNRITSCAGNQTGIVRNGSTGTIVCSFKTKEIVSNIAFNSSGSLFATSSKSEVNIRDADSAAIVDTIPTIGSGPADFDFFPDDRRIAIVTSTGGLQIWDTQSKSNVLSLKNASLGGDRKQGVRTAGRYTEITQSAPFSLAISSSGTLALPGENSTIKIVDTTLGNTLAVFVGHTDTVTSIAFTEDERRMVSASWDNTVKIWDVESQEELMSLPGHRSHVREVDISRDGYCLASLGNNGNLKIWNRRDQNPTAKSSQSNGSIAGMWSDPLWRLKQSHNAASYGNTYAEAFHLGWQLKEQSDLEGIEQIHSRLAIALAKLDEAQRQCLPTFFRSKAKKK